MDFFEGKTILVTGGTGSASSPRWKSRLETVYGRVVTKLTSDHALQFMLDPEIHDKPGSSGARGKGKVVMLKKSGSLCRMQTCNPKAKIESKTYHFILVDEAQEADEMMIAKSIKPMLAWNSGSIVLSGTARPEKSYFYRNDPAEQEGRCQRPPWAPADAL